jgi:hypothetical protein
VHTRKCLSLDFSYEIFIKRYYWHKVWWWCVFPNLFHWVVRVFHSTTELEPSLFSLGFWRNINEDWTSIVQGGVLRIQITECVYYTNDQWRVEAHPGPKAHMNNDFTGKEVHRTDATMELSCRRWTTMLINFAPHVHV